MISKPVTPVPTLISTPDKFSVNGSQIRLVEVTDRPDRYQEPLWISLYGGAFAGKSRFIGTAPSKIGVVPLDRKSRMSVIESAKSYGHRVVMPEIDLIRVSNPMKVNGLPKTCVPPPNQPENVKWTAQMIQDQMQEIASKIALDGPQPVCCKRHYYRWHINRVKSVAFRMAEDPEIKTIAIDPFGAFVQDVEYANYGTEGKIDGKEFGFAPRQDMNAELRDFLNTINHKHLILTHHMKSVWKDNRPTNKVTLESAWGKTGYFSSVVVRLDRLDHLKEGQGRYQMFIDDCTANASLIGESPYSDDGITFGNLAQLVYEESQPEDWE